MSTAANSLTTMSACASAARSVGAPVAAAVVQRHPVVDRREGADPVAGVALREGQEVQGPGQGAPIRVGGEAGERGVVGDPGEGLKDPLGLRGGLDGTGRVRGAEARQVDQRLREPRLVVDGVDHGAPVVQGHPVAHGGPGGGVLVGEPLGPRELFKRGRGRSRRRWGRASPGRRSR